MLIGLYNKCKSYENSLITWDLEAPTSTLIKNLSLIWFSMRLTNTAHKDHMQEWSTPWTPLEEQMVSSVSKITVLNCNHFTRMSQETPPRVTGMWASSSGMWIVSQSLGEHMRSSRGLKGNTPWSDPVGQFLSSFSPKEFLEGNAQVSQPKLFTIYWPKSLQPRRALMAREMAALHLLCAGGMDLSSQLCCPAQGANGAKKVQWNVQPLNFVMFIHTQVVFKHGPSNYPKSTLANTPSDFQLIALKNRVSPLLNKQP